MQYIYPTGQNNGRIAESIDGVTGEDVLYTYDSLQRLIKTATTGQPSHNAILRPCRGLQQTEVRGAVSMRGINRMVIGVALCIASLLATVLSAQDFTYRKVSKHVYDEALLIPKESFERPHLLDLMKAFGARQCKEYSLARLTIAMSQRDLGNSLNSDLPDLLVARHLLEAGLGSPQIAQVFCVSGAAVGVIREGSMVSTHQLSGSKDPRSIIDGQFRIAGFRVRAESSPEREHGPRPLPERVWVYARGALPDMNTAASLRRALEERLHVYVYLILRNDPFFFHYDGPVCDIFEVPGHAFVEKSYLARPSVVCEPSLGADKCRLEAPIDGSAPGAR